MFKILHARLQQYVNCELPGVLVGFRKGKQIRDQIASICWIIEKATDFQKNISLCFIDYARAFDWTWNNRLVPNRKRSMSRLYTVTLLI